MIVQSLVKAQSGRHLTEEEAFATFREIMNGEVVSEAVLASLLTAMQMNRPNVAEVTGAVRAMRDVCLRVNVPDDAVDIVGTGGDEFCTFNVSTTAAIIAAGAGVTIAKHGNRAATSKSGSADCLAALGYNLMKPLPEVERSIRENGIGFLFANRCHPAMMYAAPVRKALPFRTIFNLLGPLSNPAGVKRYALGVYAPDVISLYVETLKALGVKKAVVFCGPNGLDELGLAGTSQVAELGKDGGVKEYVFDPKKVFGAFSPVEAIRGGDPAENARIALDIISGKDRGVRRDAAALNAAAAILAGGKADSIEEGLGCAYASMDSGRAYAKLQALIFG